MEEKTRFNPGDRVRYIAPAFADDDFGVLGTEHVVEESYFVGGDEYVAVATIHGDRQASRFELIEAANAETSEEVVEEPVIEPAPIAPAGVGVYPPDPKAEAFVVDPDGVVTPPAAKREPLAPLGDA